MFEVDLCLFWLISEALGSPNQCFGLCKVGLFLVGIVYILDFLIGRSEQEDAEGEPKMKEEQEDQIVKGASLGW